MKLLISILLTIALLILWTVVIVKSIQFDRNCEGNLKRAADANTIEIAKKELRTALDYIEKNNLTHGYTSAIYETPDEDLGFWYNNLKTSYSELDSLKPDAQPMEKSNMLMKLRETLIDHGDKGDDVTVPDGISRYPNNMTFGLIQVALLIACAVSWGVYSIEENW